MPPVFLTSTFETGCPDQFDYTRSSNPNFRLLQKRAAALEGAQFATCIARGVSAITAVMSTPKSGDLVVAEKNVCGCTCRLFDRVFAKFGLHPLREPRRASQLGRNPPVAPGTGVARKPHEPHAEHSGCRRDRPSGSGARCARPRGQHLCLGLSPAAARARRHPLAVVHDEIRQRPQRLSRGHRSYARKVCRSWPATSWPHK